MTCLGVCSKQRSTVELLDLGVMRDGRGRGNCRGIPNYNPLYHSFPLLRPRHIGLCNFNYFISGNPSNIQRRCSVEGEMPLFLQLERIRRRRRQRRQRVLFFLQRCFLFVRSSPFLTASSAFIFRFVDVRTT